MTSLDQLLGIQTDSSNTPTSSTAAATPAAAVSSATSSQFITNIFNQLVQSTRIANAIADPDDFKHLSSTSLEFAQQAAAVQSQIHNLLGLISDAITHKGESSLVRNRAPGSSTAVSTTFSSKKDSLDRFHQLSDTVDTALEAVDLCLDAHRGVKRGNTSISTSGVAPRSQFHSGSTMLKPQRNFAHLIDNSTRTWIPIITEKPNALKPLPDYEKLRCERERKQNMSGSPLTSSSSSHDDANMENEDNSSAEASKLSAAMTSHLANLGQSADIRSPSTSIYPHPYKYEIENLDYTAVRAKQLQNVKEQLFEPLSKIPCTWVDSEEGLNDMIEVLEHASEIAIDLEHHSFRSYYGLTCLMQLSTRKADFLVDTLALRTSLHKLNNCFTNPAIVKVLHGADSDIIWLQRDFGLYIVNLFDTGQAARVLEFPSFGLAYLLKHFCDVNTDKKYQLADWRIRPLSAEMLLYARMDTHYLLYIYDRLKNELISRSSPAQNQLSTIPNVSFHLSQVVERSKAIALKTYEKEDMNTSNAAMEFAQKYGVVLQSEAQSRVLVALFQLRDEVARKEDESVLFMCSNPNLIKIVENQPTDTQQLEAVCSKPTPPFVRNYAATILKVIEEAKIKGANLTSPFLASTLPPVTGSPTMTGAHGGEGSSGFDMGAAALSAATPQKFGSKFGATGASNLPPFHMTPATAASSLFAQLSTSTPQQANSGWVSQSMSDSSSTSLLNPSQQSPVLSTEQLYSTANWIHASKNLASALAAAKNPHNPQLSSSAGISIPLFDDSGDGILQSPVKTSLQMSPPPKSSPFAILASPSESKESEANRQTLAQVRASFSSAAAFPHAISNIASMATGASGSTTVKSGSPSLAVSDPMEDDDSAMLRTPRTGEPAHSFVSPSPLSLQVVPSPLTVPGGSNSGNAGFASIAGELSTDKESGGGDSPLPRSMREIYKISNENRRKKKKSKTSHAGGSASTMGMEGEEEESLSASASAHNSRPGSASAKRNESNTGAATSAASASAAAASKKSSGSDVPSAAGDSHEFMKTIGWGSGTPPLTGNTSSATMQLFNNSLPQPNSANAATDAKKRKHSSAPSSGRASLSSSPPSSSPTFQPFDYSNASLPPSNPAARAFFNPYTDMGRDKLELKTAAGVAPTPGNKIYKNLNQLKSQNKNVTVRMDEGYQRQRGGSAGSGIPIPQPRNTQQRR